MLVYELQRLSCASGESMAPESKASHADVCNTSDDNVSTQHPHQVGMLDFLCDAMAGGRTPTSLYVIKHHSTLVSAIGVARRLHGQRVLAPLYFPSSFYPPFIIPIVISLEFSPPSKDALISGPPQRPIFYPSHRGRQC
jgi:hypothetical protein